MHDLTLQGYAVPGITSGGMHGMRIQYGATVVSFLVVELLLTGNNTRVRINNQPICKNCYMQVLDP